MISIIFSADYEFQILNIVKGDSNIAWDIANDLFGENKNPKIDHYDVIEFYNLTEANNWILQQVNNSRK